MGSAGRRLEQLPAVFNGTDTIAATTMTSLIHDTPAAISRAATLRARLPIAAVVVAMLASIGVASRFVAHNPGCQSREEVEARVGTLSQRLQSLANSHRISMEDLGTAIKAVNAADVRFTPAGDFEQHCMVIEQVGGTLPEAHEN